MISFHKQCHHVQTICGWLDNVSPFSCGSEHGRLLILEKYATKRGWLDYVILFSCGARAERWNGQRSIRLCAQKNGREPMAPITALQYIQQMIIPIPSNRHHVEVTGHAGDQLALDNTTLLCDLIGRLQRPAQAAGMWYFIGITPSFLVPLPF